MRYGRALPLLAVAVVAVFVALTAACGPWVGGIHAVMRYRTQQDLLVERVPANGPAARAGLQPGDEITAIEGSPVRRMSQTDVRRALSGEVGTRVRVTIRRDGVERDISIERAPYQS